MRDEDYDRAEYEATRRADEDDALTPEEARQERRRLWRKRHAPRLSVTFEDDRGFVHILPGTREVCDRCDGHGTHLHPDIGGHAYSMEEFRESFDEEEATEYFKRGGRYDVQCTVCHGHNVVTVPDEDACQRSPRLRALFNLYVDITESRARADAEWKAEIRHEARMLGEWDGD